MSTESPSPAPPVSGRRSPGRVLAAIWLGVSQAIVIAAFLVVLLVMAVLSEGYRPFDVHPVRGDPTFGFLSGLELRMALPVLGLAV